MGKLVALGEAGGAILAALKIVAPKTFAKVSGATKMQMANGALTAGSAALLVNELAQLFTGEDIPDSPEVALLKGFLERVTRDSVFIEHLPSLTTDANNDGSPEIRGTELAEMLKTREKLRESERLIRVLVNAFGSLHRAKEIWTALMKVEPHDFLLAEG